MKQINVVGYGNNEEKINESIRRKRVLHFVF